MTTDSMPQPAPRERDLFSAFLGTRLLPDGVKRLVYQPRFKVLAREFGDRPFALLDIGAGNHSATRTKHFFPKCQYHGVDNSRAWGNDHADFQAMQAFYELDLTKLDFSALPEQHFDAIVLSHVIEHLHNGDHVLRGLLGKLKPGGICYVEFPGERAFRMPSLGMSLNFYDEPTHVRVFTLHEVCNVATTSGCKVVRYGVRRDWPRLLLSPAIALIRLLRSRALSGSDFYDVLGWANYALFRKAG